MQTGSLSARLEPRHMPRILSRGENNKQGIYESAGTANKTKTETEKSNCKSERESGHRQIYIDSQLFTQSGFNWPSFSLLRFCVCEKCCAPIVSAPLFFASCLRLELHAWTWRQIEGMRSIRSRSLLRRKIPQLNRGYKLEVYFSPSSRFSARASGLFQHPIWSDHNSVCFWETAAVQPCKADGDNHK